MLAWVHQAVASEKELLMSLLLSPEAVAAKQDSLDIEGISLYVLIDKVCSASGFVKKHPCHVLVHLVSAN